MDHEFNGVAMQGECRLILLDLFEEIVQPEQQVLILQGDSKISIT